MKKIIALLAALMLLCCGCQAEVATEAPAETAAVTPAITDAATFAEACAAYGEYPFGAFPNTILLDNAAFETAITSGSGVVFIADPSDLNSRVLAPVLFEQKDGAYYTGYTPNYVKVYAEGEALHNTLCAVTVTGVYEDGVLGRLDK